MLPLVQFHTMQKYTFTFQLLKVIPLISLCNNNKNVLEINVVNRKCPQLKLLKI